MNHLGLIGFAEFCHVCRRSNLGGRWSCAVMCVKWEVTLNSCIGF